MPSYDVMVVGGGIVGLATAVHLLETQPTLRLALVEKETEVGAHQSGRNSGVLHSGVYYPAGSLKARHCAEGRALMMSFCAAEEIPIELCGKVIVATCEDELPRLNALHESAKINGVNCRLVDANELKGIEPSVAGLSALYVPEAGVVDYSLVCVRLASKVRSLGGELRLGEEVLSIRSDEESLKLETTAGVLESKALVNCAGLHSDKLVEMTGAKSEARIVPFRGEYYALTPAAIKYCRGLIYPVPNPQFPFLGVHLTKQVDGGVICGPNAVLAMRREGYGWRDLDLRELGEIVFAPGFLRFARRHWRVGLSELWRSLSKRKFLESLRTLVPQLELCDLERAPSGVRAQAMARDGSLVDDFLIQRIGRVWHVANAPSPAATSSLSIGKAVAERVLHEMEEQ